MNASIKNVSPDRAAQAQRLSVAFLIAKHIEVMLAIKGWALVRGTPMTTAEELIRSWSPNSIEVFLTLAMQDHSEGDRFTSKSALAKSVRCGEKSLHDFWSKTLAKAAIPVRDSKTGEERAEKLFRRERERKFSGDGIALYLGLAQANFQEAMRIVETTGAVTTAFRENLEGAIECVEQNEALSDEERAAPRRLLEEREPAAVEGPQLSLVSGAK